jgi:hypothetical protein
LSHSVGPFSLQRAHHGPRSPLGGQTGKSSTDRLQLVDLISAHRLACFVEEVPGCEIPPDFTREGFLRELPDGVGVWPIHVDLTHEVTTRAVSREAVARDERRNLPFRQLLGPKLIRRKKEDGYLLTVDFVPGG